MTINRKDIFIDNPNKQIVFRRSNESEPVYTVCPKYNAKIVEGEYICVPVDYSLESVEKDVDSLIEACKSENWEECFLYVMHFKNENKKGIVAYKYPLELVD